MLYFCGLICFLKKSQRGLIFRIGGGKKLVQLLVLCKQVSYLTCLPIVSGFKPMQYFEEDQQNSLSTDKNSAIKPLISLSPKEICSRQPYLVFSILFLCLRILLYVLPGMVAHLRTFWVSYVPHLNLQIFGETSQVMGRVLQMMDVRRAWTKLRLSKTRSFHQRAKSARVWASSLTSVSLGETSSART